MALPRVALIAGPTASGKSALAMAIARRHDGVVVNADSAQVYRDLRILSARPSPDDEAAVPHRLFGHIDGADICSAARWAGDARVAIAEAHAAGQLPVLVGGTGLYLRTLLDGIAPVPEVAPAIRAEVRALPVSVAHARLAVADPAAAMHLAPADTMRVARALEVKLSSGRTLAEWQARRVGGIGETVTLLPMILLPDRDWLFARCDARLAAMVADGGVDEVRALLARRDVPADAPVRMAIGMREIAAMLAGEISEAAALAQARLATRRYAKRQYTWFRNQPPVDWTRTNHNETNNIIHFFESKLLI
ncbi:tRNA (adenosine(37)-N6)-dimethylallyltransferase MiaA [uncultured Sphingomonas sp.]|uniref:tRNA (adenosine(37)-N6)-dimethylallyltransferase MiaA n=1 Tax=uncultured Sphingomonas sp. TaxID=158754 RepID=UPI0035CC7DF8